MKQNIFSDVFNYAGCCKAQFGKRFYSVYFGVGHKFFDVVDL